MGYLDWFRRSKDSRDYLVKRVPRVSHRDLHSPSTHGTDEGHYGVAQNRMAESAREAVGDRSLGSHLRRKLTSEVVGEGIGPLQRKLVERYGINPDAEYAPTVYSGAYPEELQDALGIAADIASIAMDEIEPGDDPEENERRVREAGDQAIEGFARRLPWNRS